MTFRRGCRAGAVGALVAAAFWSPSAVPADVHATLVVDDGVLGVVVGASFAVAAFAVAAVGGLIVRFTDARGDFIGGLIDRRVDVRRRRRGDVPRDVSRRATPRDASLRR